MSRKPTHEEPSLFGALVEQVGAVDATALAQAVPRKPPPVFIVDPRITRRSNGRLSVLGREFDAVADAQAWVDAGAPHPITGALALPRKDK